MQIKTEEELRSILRDGDKKLYFVSYTPEITSHTFGIRNHRIVFKSVLEKSPDTFFDLSPEISRWIFDFLTTRGLFENYWFAYAMAKKLIEEKLDAKQKAS